MNPKIGLYEKGLDLAARVGPVCGGAGGLFYTVAYVIYFIRDHDLSNLAQASFGLAFAMIAVGLGRALKKTTDIIVASEAEKRNDTNTPMSDRSVVPQIQREIEKQKAEAVVAGRETK